jgi:hypothetical protein
MAYTCRQHAVYHNAMIISGTEVRSSNTEICIAPVGKLTYITDSETNGGDC